MEGMVLKCRRFVKQCMITEYLQCSHLICFDFVNQVFEGRQSAEADHGLALVSAQTLHLRHRGALQHNLITTQEVLELHIARGLAVGRESRCNDENYSDCFMQY